jgi:hypothetical protein
MGITTLCLSPVAMRLWEYCGCLMVLRAFAMKSRRLFLKNNRHAKEIRGCFLWLGKGYFDIQVMEGST